MGGIGVGAGVEQLEGINGEIDELGLKCRRRSATGIGKGNGVLGMGVGGWNDQDNGEEEEQEEHEILDLGAQFCRVEMMSIRTHQDSTGRQLRKRK